MLSLISASNHRKRTEKVVAQDWPQEDMAKKAGVWVRDSSRLDDNYHYGKPAQCQGEGHWKTAHQVQAVYVSVTRRKRGS